MNVGHRGRDVHPRTSVASGPARGNGAMFTQPDVSFGLHDLNGIEVATWDAAGLEHDGRGTAFVLVSADARVDVAHGTYPLPGGGYAVLPDRARVQGGRGVAVTALEHRGLFQIGGPVEREGRLRYIDGCSDTVLVSPVRRGDPCLNLLSLPAATVQSDHQHPSVRVGLVVTGSGRCIMGDGHTEFMRAGTVFVLPARSTHRFETDAHCSLGLMAWHPDSDFGPTDDDHPMLNRTLRPGSSVRVR